MLQIDENVAHTLAYYKRFNITIFLSICKSIQSDSIQILSSFYTKKGKYGEVRKWTSLYV